MKKNHYFKKAVAKSAIVKPHITPPRQRLILDGTQQSQLAALLRIM